MGKTRVEYDLFAIFVAIADELSFSRAANKLGIGKGTVSRALRSLEALVGAELIHRTTHEVALSTAGIALYEHTAIHLRALDQALASLPEHRQEPSGELRMTAPHDLATIFLPQLVAEFARRYPDVTFDIHVTNAVVDLVAGGFDLAIRVAPRGLRDSSLTARKLGRASIGFYASPSYIARRGEPSAVADARHDWLILPAMVAHAPKNLRPYLLVDDVLMLCNLLRQGVGVGRLPRFVADPYLTDGTLVQVLAHATRGAAGSFFFVYPSTGQVPRKVSVFRDFLIERLKTRPLDA